MINNDNTNLENMYICKHIERWRLFNLQYESRYKVTRIIIYFNFVGCRRIVNSRIFLIRVFLYVWFKRADWLI